MRSREIPTKPVDLYLAEKRKRGSKPAIDLAGYHVVVVVPAHNEERYIGSVVLKLMRYQAEVIVVDDGSQDDTAFLAEGAGAAVIRLEQNQGKAAALNVGFEQARRRSPDAIVMLDADAQHRPEELAAIAAPVLEGKADLVIGSRYLKNTSNTPTGRRLGHGLINLLTALSSGSYSSDSQSGYRAFSRKAYECCDFHSQGFTVESEMQFLAHENGLVLAEVPITIRYHDRPKRSAFQQGLHVLGGVIKLTGQYRPLLFFSGPGFVLLAGGLGLGLVVVERFAQFGELAVGYALVCVLLSVLGVVMFSTGVMIHSVRGLLHDMLKNKITLNNNHERS